MRVTGVFTGCSSSPSPSPRQRPNRYAIRAGRNLPDKEFRYLRTVIVTAAVYRGFSSGLLLADDPSLKPSGTGQASVPILPLGSLQAPVFLVNSRLGLFTAPLRRGDPFSRSYGVILPSSLARVLSNALVSSTHLPVSVCGTVARAAPLEGFLVSVESSGFGFLRPSPSRLSL